MPRLIVFLALFWVLLPVSAEEESSEAKTKAVSRKVARSLDALRSINSAIDEVETDLQRLRDKMAAEPLESAKKSIAEEVATLESRLATLQTEFGQLAAGVAREEFDAIDKPAFDVQQEIQEVLRPIFRDLNDATTDVRELDEMRTRLELLRQREELANGAVERLQGLLEKSQDPLLQGRLQEMLSAWEGRAQQESTQGEALQLRIEENSQSDVSIFRRLSNGAMLFCKTRGKNLLFAILTLVAVYSFFRWIYCFIKKVSPFHRGQVTFVARLIDVVYSVLSLVAGVFAAFAVLYNAGDWVLLVLGLLFVLGILWASKNTLPHFFEQTKLLLNLGPVRQGERLVHDGIPWRVDSLGIYCEFKNPLLTGGVLRLPLRSVVDMYSRPCDEKEPWFPTELSEWVKVSDAGIGRVVVQTPEQVELVKLGGSRVFYPTASFLELAPENLSRNFRIEVTFGIDYAHQAISTTEVPAIFENRIQKELLDAVGAEGLKNVTVEFKEAAASSLDYQINADFAGDIAARHNTLQRMISRICVDVCNEQGYGIPFTQVTIHQAE